MFFTCTGLLNGILSLYVGTRDTMSNVFFIKICPIYQQTRGLRPIIVIILTRLFTQSQKEPYFTIITLQQKKYTKNSPESGKIRVSLHEEMAHISVIIRPLLVIDPLLNREELLVHEWRSSEEIMLCIVGVLPPLRELEGFHRRIQYVHVHRNVLFEE